MCQKEVSSQVNLVVISMVHCQYHRHSRSISVIKRSYFLHILLKFKIVWVRIGYVARLQNYVNSFGTPYNYLLFFLFLRNLFQVS